MNVLKRLRSWWLADQLTQNPVKAVTTGMSDLRARPLQSLEARLNPSGVSLDVVKYVAAYYRNAWVNTASARMATLAASTPLHVIDRHNSVITYPDHPVLELLGKYGIPNDAQDSFEFWENHFTIFGLTGNSFWYWVSRSGVGAPTEVHLLHPSQMRIIPGTDRSVAHYEYWVGGQKERVYPWQVTHFKRPNPWSSYWGLPALEAIMIEIMTDIDQATWNRNLFGDGVAVPAGVLVLPSNISPAERDRIDSEWNAEHSQRRKTAVVVGEPGSVQWVNAGLNPMDADFVKGRELNRKAIYEALDLPLGVMSEASTEAHARVAERQQLHAVWRNHIRVNAKLNGSRVFNGQIAPMMYFAGWQDQALEFVNVKYEAADWEQTSKKLMVLDRYLSADEIRTQELGIAPLAAGTIPAVVEREWHVRKLSATTGQSASGGNNNSLPNPG